MMRQYADSSGCRRGFLLGYFGEAFAPPCGRCDNCLSGRVVESIPSNVPFPLASRVNHQTWGEGEVVHYENDTVTVLFADAGYRTLATELVIQGELMRQMRV
jgi:ATP-dependent DNA helicase RecQ